MNTQSLTIGEIIELCAANGIRSKIPYSQLEAEAVRRSMDIVLVIREHLLSRLREIGIL